MRGVGALGASPCPFSGPVGQRVPHLADIRIVQEALKVIQISGFSFSPRDPVPQLGLANGALRPTKALGKMSPSTGAQRTRQRGRLGAEATGKQGEPDQGLRFCWMWALGA